MNRVHHDVHLLERGERDLDRVSVKLVVSGTEDAFYRQHRCGDGSVPSLAEHRQFIPDVHLQVFGEKLSDERLVEIVFGKEAPLSNQAFPVGNPDLPGRIDPDNRGAIGPFFRRNQGKPHCTKRVRFHAFGFIKNARDNGRIRDHQADFLFFVIPVGLHLQMPGGHLHR